MRNAKFGFLVLAVAISLPIAGYLTEKVMKDHVRNVMTIKYKVQNAVTPNAFYQKTKTSPYADTGIVTTFKEDKKEGYFTGKIIFPKGRLYVLRLDFGSNPGKVEISRLSFRSAPITREILEKSNFQNVSGIQFPKGDEVHFSSNHVDPFIIFNPRICQKREIRFWEFACGFLVTFLIIYPIFLLLEKLTRPRKKKETEEEQAPEK